MPPNPADPVDPAAIVTTPAAGQTLYFAYGSNLSPTQMAARCPGAALLGVGQLKRARWFINTRGYANVVPLTPAGQLPAAAPNEVQTRPDTEDGEHHGSSNNAELASDAATDDDDFNEAWGLIYGLSEADERALDGFEGVPQAYGKEWHAVHFWRLQQGATTEDDADLDSSSHVELLATADPFGPAASRERTAAAKLPAGRADVRGPGQRVQALVYVDRSRTELGAIKPEYVQRMRRGVLEAGQRGLPRGWMRTVIERELGDGR